MAGRTHSEFIRTAEYREEWKQQVNKGHMLGTMPGHGLTTKKKNFFKMTELKAHFIFINRPNNRVSLLQTYFVQTSKSPSLFICAYSDLSRLPSPNTFSVLFPELNVNQLIISETSKTILTVEKLLVSTFTKLCILANSELIFFLGRTSFIVSLFWCYSQFQNWDIPKKNAKQHRIQRKKLPQKLLSQLGKQYDCSVI